MGYYGPDIGFAGIVFLSLLNIAPFLYCSLACNSVFHCFNCLLVSSMEWLHRKWFIALELALVVALITGHNLFRILPNETPFIFLLGWLSLRLRGMTWSSVGLGMKRNWPKVIFSGLLLAIGLQLISTFVSEPLIVYLTGAPPSDFSSFDDTAGNEQKLLVYLLMSWVLAAFGEELSFRGYFLNRMADMGNQTRLAWTVSILAQSALFGIAHYYQGLTGMIDTGITALILAGAYLLSGRNLWLVIFAHGFADTLFFVLLYFDLVKYLH
jgi:membrane protease YdiL (CAAX protease family)